LVIVENFHRGSSTAQIEPAGRNSIRAQSDSVRDDFDGPAKACGMVSKASPVQAQRWAAAVANPRSA